MNNPFYSFAKRVAKRIIGITKLFEENPNSFLKDISGVVHVGANIGQERKTYDKLGLKVIWIEPIPEIYTKLMENLVEYKDQRAFMELVTDVDNKNYEFNVANNNGASSSIYDLKDHKDIWPQVNFQESISISSITLTSLFKRELIDVSEYQALSMDTQGSELLVLMGSIPILKNFKYIKTEVADFESYEGCCQLDEMSDFMTEHGFEEFHRVKYSRGSKEQNYYDIVYKEK